MNAPGETRNSAAPQQGGETALLLVDDDPNMGLLLGEALDKSRYRLQAVERPQEAFERCLEESPDLILLDVVMPQLSGYEVLSQLQQSPLTSFIPVAFLSNDPQLEKRLRAFRMGAIDFIPKDIGPTAIASRIDRIVKELPFLPGEVEGLVGDKTVDEVLDLIRKDLRPGMLSINFGDLGDKASLKLATGSGPAFAKKLDEILAQAKKQGGAKGATLKFVEADPARFRQIDFGAGAPARPIDKAAVAGTKVLLVGSQPEELEPLAKTLRAAALTYVAAAVSTLLTLLYFLLRSGLLGGRRD